MLSKQRNRLFIHKRGDLRLYLTKMYPNISKLCEGSPNTSITLNWGPWYVSISWNKVLHKYYVFASSGLGATTMSREWKGGDGTKKFEKHCDRLWAVGMLVANIWYQLMQIIVYLPSFSWIQLLVLMRATRSNGFQCALQKDLEQWCSQTFWLGWSKTRMPRFAHELNKCS